MFPLFFGPPDEPLYGVYHAPEPAVARPLGAVICQPILHEAADAHRALRALADMLARAGLHVLRFDLYGTGDSSGSAEQSSVAGWIRDVGAALDELRASRSLSAVGLVGLRFGATLAARASSEQGHELPFLVLWEPVVRGAPYVESLRQLQELWLAHETRERPGAPGLATADEIVGFPFTPGQAGELGAVDLLTDAPPRAARTLLVDEGAGADLQALAARLGSEGCAVDSRRVDGGHVWRREFDGEQAAVPRQLLSDVTDWIVGGAPEGGPA